MIEEKRPKKCYKDYQKKWSQEWLAEECLVETTRKQTKIAVKKKKAAKVLRAAKWQLEKTVSVEKQLQVYLRAVRDRAMETVGGRKQL